MKRCLFNILIAVLCLLSLSLISCQPESGVEKGDSQKTVEDQLNKMYDYLNAGDYDSYLSYMNFDEELKNAMKTSFEYNSTIFSSKYELDNVEIISDEDGVIVALIQTLNTSVKLSDNTKRVFKETITYTFEISDGEYKIKTFDIGATEIVDVPGEDTETMSEDEFNQKIIDQITSDVTSD